METLKKDEVIFRQLMLKINSGGQRKKTKAVLAFEVRLKTLGTRFENNGIDGKQYFKVLSFLVANKK